MQCSDVLTETGVRSFPKDPIPPKQQSALQYCQVGGVSSVQLQKKNSADVADAGDLVSTQKRISIWGGCLIGNS